MTVRKEFVHGKWIEVETIDTGVDVPKIRRARAETFVKVPLEWARKASAAIETPKMMVLLYLLYRAWREHSDTITLPNNALTDYGVSRKLKRRALQQLEAAGLITIKRRAGKSPTVTLVL